MKDNNIPRVPNPDKTSKYAVTNFIIAETVSIAKMVFEAEIPSNAYRAMNPSDIENSIITAINV
jgi:hypothetical protein